MLPRSWVRSPLTVAFIAILVGACDSGPPNDTPPPGVVYTFPANNQVDLPDGARIVVAFSEAVVASAVTPCTAGDPAPTKGICIVGPSGVVAANGDVTPDGDAVEFVGAQLAPGTKYGVYVGSDIDPVATNLPTSGPLFSFTTRSDRARAAPPTLVAINGGDPSNPESFRPMLDTTTIELVFSEPLDPRSIQQTPTALELVDSMGNTVPAVVLSEGVHVALDPLTDLTAGETYTLQLGPDLVDLGGDSVEPLAIPLTPRDTQGSNGHVTQVLRVRAPSDPGPTQSKTGAPQNSVTINKPLIGMETQTIEPGSLTTELGDPTALTSIGGPIGFVIRRGQRLHLTGFSISLGGQIPTGLQTGDTIIEVLTDGGGRLYRNPYHDPSTNPDDTFSPLWADLTLDLAVYAVDPQGNASLTQTVLGVQATGIVDATDGVLAMDSESAMSLGLLGVASAPANLVLSVITDETAMPEQDITPPTLTATYPPASSVEFPVDGGVELIFSEPIDLSTFVADFTDSAGDEIPYVVVSNGAAVTLRPTFPVAYSQTYTVNVITATDLAGNPLAAVDPLTFETTSMSSTSVPLTVSSVYPGVPCALVGGTLGGSPGRCSGGQSSDDLYQPFTLPADQNVEVQFSQTPEAGTVVAGAVCNSGSIRVEQLDDVGACVNAVPGTFIVFDHAVRFVPDSPWTVGTTYRLVVVSGGSTSCTAGDLCGIGGGAASFDTLSGMDDSNSPGGPPLIEVFTAVPADPNVVFLFTGTTPQTDTNGDGAIDGTEVTVDGNRAGLTITGTSGPISASFSDPDCDPATGEQACMYLGGGMPTLMGATTTDCALPDGTTVPVCMPVTMSPQLMYATTLAMKAKIVDVFDLTTDTNTSIMRIREPATGPVTAYIYTGSDGTPQVQAQLDLYMDAPDMSLPLSSHDLHSKPITVVLQGALVFLPDGRISLTASNQADVPITVNISAPFGISAAVDMVLSAGQMKMQLVSPPLRGASL